MNIENYLGLKHQYGSVDCINLIKVFYNNELGVTFETPNYTLSTKWFKHLTEETIELWLSKYSVKVSLTSVKNYDLIVFKEHSFITHFGMYLDVNRMLHVEQGSVSKIENINTYWNNKTYGIYRHKELV